MKSKTFIVLKHEFLKIVKTKTFIITTILGPFLMAALIAIPTLVTVFALDRSSEIIHIGIHTEHSSELLHAVKNQLHNAGWIIHESSNKEELIELALDGDIEGYLRAEENDTLGYYSKDIGNQYIVNTIQNIADTYQIEKNLAIKGLDYAEIENLMHPHTLTYYKISKDNIEGKAGDGMMDFMANLLIPLIFSLMIYMSVLLYGQMIGRSVVTEKSTKIVDVLLSSVKAEQLLFGKILGVGLAGLVQYLTWIMFAIIGIAVAAFGFKIDLPEQISLINFIYLGVFFILGYVLYAACYAAMGAASEDEQHMAQLSTPFIMFLVIPMVMISNLTQNPSSAIATFFSLFPLTSPMSMLAVATTGKVALWQISLSIALLVLTILLVVRLASKIFKTGILMTGKNFKFKEIAQWLK